MLHITRTELAAVSGRLRDTVSKRAHSASRATQARPRDTVEIINRVTGWSGSVRRGLAWFRSEPLPSCGDTTAEDLFREGRAQAVKDYLARIAGGGCAEPLVQDAENCRTDMSPSAGSVVKWKSAGWRKATPAFPAVIPASAKSMFGGRAGAWPPNASGELALGSIRLLVSAAGARISGRALIKCQEDI